MLGGYLMLKWSEVLKIDPMETGPLSKESLRGPLDVAIEARKRVIIGDSDQIEPENSGNFITTPDLNHIFQIFELSH